MDTITRHFVLVHGACHGAWCWYKIVTLLKSVGHKVTTLDMAASGIHPKQVNELNSIVDYYEPLIEFIKSLPQDERVILVAHSFGGTCISMAMELFPKKIAVAVFVTAFMHSPDLSFLTILQEYNQRLDSILDTKIMFDDSPKDKPNGSMLFGPQFLATKLYQLSPPEYNQILDSTMDTKIIFDDSPKDKPNGSILFGPQFLATKLYQLSPPKDLSLAMSLVRPVRSLGDQEQLQKETRVTKDNYGTVAKVYIVCQQDNILKNDFQLSMIERSPTNDVKVIVDADHMPMFSKPKELFAYLQEIAKTYH